MTFIVVYDETQLSVSRQRIVHMSSSDQSQGSEGFLMIIHNY